jgi:hypothetical protein
MRSRDFARAAVSCSGRKDHHGVCSLRAFRLRRRFPANGGFRHVCRPAVWWSVKGFCSAYDGPSTDNASDRAYACDRPLRGGLSACSSAGGASSVAKNRGVLLVPQMHVGWAGWCLAELPGGGCASGKSRPPVIAETWTSEGPPSITFGYALTMSQVLSVSIDGESPIPTRNEVGLPDGLRAVVVEIRDLNLETADARPRLRPLNQKGETIGAACGTSAPNCARDTRARSANPQLDEPGAAHVRRLPNQLKTSRWSRDRERDRYYQCQILFRADRTGLYLLCEHVV